MYSRFTILLLISLLVVSCNSKEDQLVIDAEKFSSKIIEKAKQMTDKDWSLANKNYEELMRRYEKLNTSMTEVQQDKFNKEIGRYQGAVLKSGMNDILDEMKEFGKQMEGVIEILTDSTNQ